MLVCLPALNEEKTVAEVIRRIPRHIDGVSSVDVLVVDDGSTDRTASLAAEAGATVVSHPRSKGVGAAFHTALAYAINRPVDLIVTLDADGQFDPALIPKLIAPVLRDEADFVTASRFVDPALVPDMPWIKRWGNGMMSRLISRIAGNVFHDVSCGMRCYGRKAAMHLNLLGTFTYTQEVFLNLAFKVLRIAEVPIPVRGQRKHGRSRVAPDVWRYGVKAMWIIFRCYRDYHPMRFFGWLAAGLMVPGVGLAILFLVHYWQTGRFAGYKWAAFTGAAMFALGVLLLLTGLVGDMLNRHRIYLEEVLYYVRTRKAEVNGRHDPRRPDTPGGRPVSNESEVTDGHQPPP